MNFRYTLQSIGSLIASIGIFVTPLLLTLRRLPKLHLTSAAIALATSIGAALLWPESARIPPVPKHVALEASPTTSQPAQDTLTSSMPRMSDNILPAVMDQPAPIPERVENWVEYPIKSGDNLTTLFKRAGLGPRDVYKISQAVSGSESLQRLRPGQTFAFLIEDGLLRKLRHVQNRLNTTLIELTDSGYQVEKQVRTPDTRITYAEGTIKNSLFLDAAEAGLADNTIMQLAEIFAWDVDFALDLRTDDRFRVLYEQDYIDDEYLDQSRILAAEFTNRGRVFTAVRYTDSQGVSHYYTPTGDSMHKAFLRSPVDFRRISSGFKPERYHPVLGKKRPHRGVDYAAATGTPIRAAGDGKIIWRGTKGGYGRTLILQHGSNITTLYAHMSRYQKGLGNGSRVKQGQIIGYVGASGLATGPHLHYEFRIGGVHKNPLTVPLPAAAPVSAAERPAFEAEAVRLVTALKRQADTRLAMAPSENQP
ncbi:murein DD-endopeptidase MepM/ murein hydrolase activator NlpD [Marinobacterium halophilum]|uniref:Murein DD-endopeptidase MepM/ murein hydrolase activator NlpD n=2 Tax=Marinobacterium halophilum TaxID=267374 RepID=A0A2P8ELZ1_9GAMM|nr:murein DD-endopeptidase MepM/ murein hydrolase activator NlpD [Marinobacterium halophilum]